MTKYIADRQERIKSKEISDYALFGQFGGILLVLIGYSRFISTINDIPSTIYRYLTFLGLILWTLGVVCPIGVSWFYKAISFIGNHIGGFIFSLLLTVLYWIMVVPVGLFMKREKEKSMLISWNEDYSDETTTGFTDWKGSNAKVRGGFVGTVLNLVGRLIGDGHSFLLPVVVLLVAIGIILFFVSSSVMAPFIYTLF